MPFLDVVYEDPWSMISYVFFFLLNEKEKKTEKFIAVVWIWQCLKAHHITDFVLDMTWEGGGGAFIRSPSGRQSGHGDCTFEGVLDSQLLLVFPPHLSCYEGTTPFLCTLPMHCISPKAIR